MATSRTGMHMMASPSQVRSVGGGVSSRRMSPSVVWWMVLIALDPLRLVSGDAYGVRGNVALAKIPTGYGVRKRDSRTLGGRKEKR
ncbi:hypothetical protein GCM10009722_15820 [Williamsia deligens]